MMAQTQPTPASIEVRDFPLKLMERGIVNSSTVLEPMDYSVNSMVAARTPEKRSHDIRSFFRGASFDRWTIYHGVLVL